MNRVQQAARILAPQPKTIDPGWQQAHRDVISDPAELWRLLNLDPAELPGAQLATRQFPLRLPRQLLDRIEPGNAEDPVLRQYLPSLDETAEVPGFSMDPVGDLGSIESAGLLQKYRGRALLITTGACAVHCRYCFRRHFPYSEHTQGQWDAALETLHDSADISEIILSGGDPLSLSDRKLTALIEQLSTMPGLRRLRLHTRTAIVIPERITDALLNALTATRLAVVVVVHSNHANELNPATGVAMRRLRDAGATLLNQSVLLKRVNDTPVALAELSESLFSHGVLPYYLHQLDPVAGAAHFRVGDSEAASLMKGLAARMPGYLVPRLVRETPGAGYKERIPW